MLSHVNITPSWGGGRRRWDLQTTKTGGWWLLTIWGKGWPLQRRQRLVWWWWRGTWAFNLSESVYSGYSSLYCFFRLRPQTFAFLLLFREICSLMLPSRNQKEEDRVQQQRQVFKPHWFFSFSVSHPSTTSKEIRDVWEGFRSWCMYMMLQNCSVCVCGGGG